MSFPVPGTLMIEPTESESKEEIDRFCEAMISIYEEINKIKTGEFDSHDNPLKMHLIQCMKFLRKLESQIHKTRSRFPHPFLLNNKYWSPVSRIDNAYGDRNLFCVCPPVSEYDEASSL